MLKLTIDPGDKIFVGEGDNAIVISFDRKTQTGAALSVNAPREIPVHTIFADPAKQFKNRRKAKEQS